jgi:UDP-N-acetylglucosamine/UDP-N-acetylgalactosamine diphosphorylase
MTAELDKKFEALLPAVREAGQEHLFSHWARLPLESRHRLLDQIAEIDFTLIERLYHTLVLGERATQEDALEPAPIISLAHQKNHARECEEMRRKGEELLRRGEVGALLVAGGQGSRLGFDRPKGVYPIGPVSGKSLFQLHAEKLLARSRRYNALIPWYIMTSKANDEETRAFFQSHDHFGYPADQLFFFVQGMMPAIDSHGKIIMEAADNIFLNPDGHGGTIIASGKSGALEDMHKRGLAEIFYFQVDNALIDICDPLFIGYHAAKGADMSAKVCGKRDAFERVGVIGKRGGKYAVIEYSDMSDRDKAARNAEGTLKYNAGSIAIHMFRVEFLTRELESGKKLPWHLAHKQIPYLDGHGEIIQPQEPNGYKFETFVFDAFADAKTCVLLEVDRQIEFSPIKNFSGVDSPATAMRDLCNFYAGWLEKAGVYVERDDEGRPLAKLEISPLYANDAEELAQKIPPGLKVEQELYLA